MQTEKMDFNSFASSFGPWAEKFRPFIESKEMFDIYQTLKQDAQKEVICPDSDKVFRVFQTSNPENIKSIWYLQDPYPRRYSNKVKQATGLMQNLFGLL